MGAVTVSARRAAGQRARGHGLDHDHRRGEHPGLDPAVGAHRGTVGHIEEHAKLLHGHRLERRVGALDLGHPPGLGLLRRSVRPQLLGDQAVPHAERLVRKVVVVAVVEAVAGVRLVGVELDAVRCCDNPYHQTAVVPAVVQPVLDVLDVQLDRAGGDLALGQLDGVHHLDALLMGQRHALRHGQRLEDLLVADAALQVQHVGFAQAPAVLSGALHLGLEVDDVTPAAVLVDDRLAGALARAALAGAAALGDDRHAAAVVLPRRAGVRVRPPLHLDGPARVGLALDLVGHVGYVSHSQFSFGFLGIRPVAFFIRPH